MEFAFGSDDPLRHRRLRDHEGPGDLAGLEAAEQAEDEGDLGIGGQGGMGAEEHEPELIVSDDIDEVVEPVEFGILVRFHGLDVEAVGGEMPLAAGRFATESVDGAVACGRRDPAARVGRYPGLRPPLRRDGECLGHGVLGEVDVAEDADQGGRASAGFAPEDLVERVGHPWAGRTSTGPSHAAAALAAHSRAASRSTASIIQNPPICSFVSA